MNDRKYFGINEIYSRVGDTPITPDFVSKLGRAAGKMLARHGPRRTIIDKDTHISSYMLESALEASLVAARLSAPFIGSTPAPAVAYPTRAFRTEAGIVISASHSPYYDNGIKFFFTDGTKPLDVVKEAIEVETGGAITCVDSVELGKAACIVDAVGRYTEFYKGILLNELSLSGPKIVVDCTSDAAYHIVPNILCGLGASVIVIGCKPNGVDISEEVGAANICTSQARVIAGRADLGIALGGDGGRVITVDHEDNKVDGDRIMYIIAREALRQGQLRGGVAGTSMNNVGLELALKRLGIPLARTKVDDRYVLEKVQEKGWRIGAENSGHVVLLDKTTAGNNIVAGLQVLAAMVRSHMSLHDLCSDMKMFPWLLVSVRYTASNGGPLEHENVETVTAEVEATLGNRGCVLLHKSGAEPLVCVMVEGEDEARVAEFVRRIADAVKAA